MVREKAYPDLFQGTRDDGKSNAAAIVPFLWANHGQPRTTPATFVITPADLADGGA
jgi:hypothetical protein